MVVFANWCDNFELDANEKYKALVVKQVLKTRCTVVENSSFPGNPEEFGDQPFARSHVFSAKALVDNRVVRSDGIEIIDMHFEAPEIQSLGYEPGDTIGILPENDINDVDEILSRIKGDLNRDSILKIETTDKPYLPKLCTLEFLLTNFINLRFLPLKRHLAIMAQNAEDSNEKTILEYLSSKEGSDAYKSVILEPGTLFLNVLSKFPSCRFEIDALIHMLPRLLPRPYSIASSPLDKMRLLISVLPGNQEGLCSGMIRRKLGQNCRIYFRTSNGFRLPSDETTPLILVAPGIAVGVFIGFLDHLRSKNIQTVVYLFTGFCCKDDFFVEPEITFHRKLGTLSKMSVAYSREENSTKKYVQECIRDEWEKLGQLIINKNAIIYECGEYKKMSETVTDAFTSVLEKYLEINKEEAATKIKELKQNKRYLQDIWS